MCRFKPIAIFLLRLACGLPLLTLLAVLLVASVARAEIDLPDLQPDADRYRARIGNQASPGDDVGVHLQAYKNDARAHRWTAAIGELEALVRHTPDDAETWLRLARTWRSANPNANEITAAAYNAYRIAVRNPDAAGSSASEALMILAQQFEAQGRRALAVRTWAEIGRLVADPALRDELAERSAAEEFAVTDPSKVIADTRAPRWCFDFTSALDETAARSYHDWIQLSHVVNRDNTETVHSFEVTVKEKTLCILGVSHGERYHVRLDGHLAAQDGRTLKEEWTGDAEIPSPHSDIAFKSNTLVLPINGTGTVPVKSVGVPTATLLLLHVTDRQVINEVALGHLKSSVSPQDVKALLTRSGRLVWWGSVDLNRDRNVEKPSSIPVGDILKVRAGWKPGSGGPFAAGFLSDGGSPVLGPGIYALVALPLPCTDLTADLNQSDELSGCLGANGDGANLATQWIDYTGLGLQFIRGPGGLAVAVRSLELGTPRARTRVQLVSTANRVLGEALTDADGLARFDPGLAKGALGNQLRGVYALADNGDFAFLDASQDAFDLSDRGVVGRSAPGAVDVYTWTERGIYRPGEIVMASLMVRDASARALDPPTLTVRLIAPDETPIAERAIAQGQYKAGVAIARIALPTDAATGAWRIEVRNGRDIVGTAAIQVESFVPARIQFEIAGFSTMVLRPGEPVSMKLQAEYLYGGPVANLSGRYRLSLRRAAHPFSEFDSFRFGRDSDQVIAAGPIVPIQRTGQDGSTQVSVMMDAPPKQEFPVEALLRVQLDDTDGSSVGKEFVLPLRQPQHRWIGARLAAVDTISDPTAIEILAVDSDGVRRTAHVRWELYAEDDSFEWSRSADQDQSSYQVSTQHTLVGQGEQTVGTANNGRVEIDQPPGRYKIVLFDDESGTSTDLSFVAGYEGTGTTAGRPDLVRLTLDRSIAEYAPGETATVHLRSSIQGQLMLLVVSDTVQRAFNLTLDKDGNAVLPLPVDGNWGPHPYLLATVFQGGKDNRPGPSRAVGVTSFSIIPTRARLNVSLDVPPETVPLTEPGSGMPARVTIAGATAGEPVFVQLSAVDAGILSLTDYALPDPVRYFHGQRRLGVDLLDTYGRLIRDQGMAAPVRSGGDVMGSLKGLDYTWPGVVAWVSDIVAVQNGRTEIDVPIPDFLGRLQLVAIAWTPDKSGVANAPVIVRDPVVIRQDLPRFLAPGDRTTVSFDVANVHAGAGDYDLTVSADQPLRLASSAKRRIRLGVGEHVRLDYDVTTDAMDAATRLTTTHVHAALQPIGDDTLPKLARDWVIPVRSGIDPVLRMVRTTIPPLQSLTLTTATLRSFSEGLAQGSVQARHRIASVPRLAPQPSDEELSGRAMSTDQLASRGALLLDATAEIGGWDNASDKLRTQFQSTVSDLAALQRPDGGFRTFPGETEIRSGDQIQRTAFVTDVLEQARAAALPVPVGLLKSAGNYLRNTLDRDPACTSAYAYPVFVLARLAQATYDVIDGLRQTCLHVGTPAEADVLVAREFAAASQRMFGFAMDHDVRQLVAVPDGSQRPTDIRPSVDYIYAAAELNQPGDFAGLLTTMGAALATGQPRRGQMPSLGLQQRAELILAQRRAVPASQEASIEVNGQPIRVTRAGWQSPELSLTAPSEIVVRNTSALPLVDELTLRGIPAEAPTPSASDRLIMDRKLYCFDGGLDPAHPHDPAIALERQQICAVIVEGKMTEASNDLAVLTELLPSGWEIETPDLRRNPVIAPDAPVLLRLDGADGSAILRRVAYPDRLVTLVDLSRAAHGFRFGFLVRAARPGSFVWPATYVTSNADGTWIGGTRANVVTVSK